MYKRLEGGLLGRFAWYQREGPMPLKKLFPIQPLSWCATSIVPVPCVALLPRLRQLLSSLVVSLRICTQNKNRSSMADCSASPPASAHTQLCGDHQDGAGAAPVEARPSAGRRRANTRPVLGTICSPFVWMGAPCTASGRGNMCKRPAVLGRCPAGARRNAPVANARPLLWRYAPGADARSVVEETCATNSSRLSGVAVSSVARHASAPA
jgi:hypothetical protein